MMSLDSILFPFSLLFIHFGYFWTVLWEEVNVIRRISNLMHRCHCYFAYILLNINRARFLTHLVLSK